MKTLSERIRNIRKSKGLTQLDVAEKCNISASAYGQMNQCCYNTLVRIAKALNVSTTFLLDINSE